MEIVGEDVKEDDEPPLHDWGGMIFDCSG